MLQVELPNNQAKQVPLDWSPAVRLETYREMARLAVWNTLISVPSKTLYRFVGGEVGSLGVCNFSARQLRELLQFCSEHSLPRPTVVQNECHPLLQVMYFVDTGILYCSSGSQ